jgi:hypothetical protein
MCNVTSFSFHFKKQKPVKKSPISSKYLQPSANPVQGV